VAVRTVGEGPREAHGTASRRLLALRHDLLWYPVEGPRAARRTGAQVYHCPALRAPLRRGATPTVVTVHDLIFLVRPETVSAWNRRYSRATVRRVLAAADRIVAVSHATADDLDRLLGVDGTRVRVVPNGVEEAFLRGESGALPARLAGVGPFMLFVGTPEPRKNLPRLVEAVERLRASGRGERLVVAGGEGGGRESLPASDTVVALGRVSDDELRALYAHARCLALPSLHEGFGLPALEAMAMGCPVVASGSGALPEVCGDAAVLVDPLSAASIADGIVAAIDDGERLRAAGRARALAHTWAVSAERAVAVYRELA
jgi:glycosyltransferase involved in cell wall biosynthesis